MRSTLAAVLALGVVGASVLVHAQPGGKPLRVGAIYLAGHRQVVVQGLPIEDYDKVGFALNLRVAREIGLAIPSGLRAQVDQFVE